jgi:hypothetical protein
MSEPSRWAELLGARGRLLSGFAEPVLTGIRRRDTRHPAFHGCIDWHSAVHATYALLAVARLTGDPGLTAAALGATGGVAELRLEEADLRSGKLNHEVPYGMAWLLILDREAAAAGITVYHDLAELARDKLIAHLAHSGSEFARRVADEEYDNLIWPAIGLWRWGVAFDDEAAVAAAREVATRLGAGPSGGAGPLRPGALGFFSPVHLGLLLAADTGELASVLPGLLETAAATVLWRLSTVATIHAAGLNFSQAWGLYAAWRLTGDEAIRERTASLVLDHVDMPELWRQDYHRYSHWIPQFGVFAIAETYDPPELHSGQSREGRT